VKGVKPEKDRVALFTDTLTIGETHHIFELIKASNKGYENYIIFVIPLKRIKYFKSNEKMDPNFTKILKVTGENRIHIRAYDCLVTNNTIDAHRHVREHLFFLLENNTNYKGSVKANFRFPSKNF
jgi:sugar fermentation stimulation protein A